MLQSLCAMAQQQKSWMLGPFTRVLDRPILKPNNEARFDDPMSGRMVRWESMATFNPAAVVKDGRIHVLYRAEEKLGDKEIGGHTSRIGLAVSEDGIIYQRQAAPVVFPANDDQKVFEWPGGCEDPRVVEHPDGGYVLTYTQWNREVPRLAVATSPDLRTWTKHGPVFRNYRDGRYHHRETKSGAILTEWKNGRLVAARMQGKFWMYFGVPHIWLASSEDLVHWKPLETPEGELLPVLSPRPGYFDSWLVEAGPPPLLTPQGIVVLYNAGNHRAFGDSTLPNRMYTAGQALFSSTEPWKLLDRTDEPFFRPELSFEKSGQYPEGTTFLEGLVYFRQRWWLFYGTADSMVGVARSGETAPPQ